VPFGQRRANAAATLLRLGEREVALSVFLMKDDPEALTQFIFRCRPRGVGVEALLDCLRLVSDAPKDRYPKHTRYALLLALGEFSLEEIPAARREPLLKQLAGWYGQDPSSGIHGAAGWLLRHWGQTDVAREVDQTLVPYSPEREWFTLAITVTPTPPPQPKEKPSPESSGTESAPTKAAEPTSSKADDSAKPGSASDPTVPTEKAKPEPPAQPLPPQTFYYTFIVFPPGKFTIGSVEDEPDRFKYKSRERRHDVTLTRPFALLDREITQAELIAFSPQYADYMQQANVQPTVGGFGNDWYDSVGFCRWLGQQSGLAESDQAYADPKLLDGEKYPRELETSANWAPQNWPLEPGRRGFRLPTEAEWETAVRCGARTAYGFGNEVSLLGRFGWHSDNSGRQMHPPKSLLPTMRGLFDLHGNAWEWTHDWYDGFGVDAVTDPAGPSQGSRRVCRGGSWDDDAAHCRTAFRVPSAPTVRTVNTGFRLALSLSGVSGPAEQGPGKRAEPAGEGTEGASAEVR
jgi:formylglycine-generating enzyme required for sulfatase activity